MKIKTILPAILIGLCLLIPTISYTQELPMVIVGDSVSIKTLDGNTIKGIITAKDKNHIHLQSPFIGTMIIKRESIDTIDIIQGNNKDPLAMDSIPFLNRFLHKKLKDRTWRKNHNPTFSAIFPIPNNFGSSSFKIISPTGFGLKSKQAYLQATMTPSVLSSSVGYGFSDKFSVNFSFNVNTVFESYGQAELLFTPKYAFSINEYVNFGIAITAGQSQRHDVVSFIHGICTIGKRNTHYFSVGFMYDFIDDDLKQSPIFVFSGYFQLARNLAFITENGIVVNNNDRGMFSNLSVGIRYLGKKMAIDAIFTNQQNPDLYRTNNESNRIRLLQMGILFPLGKYK